MQVLMIAATGLQVANTLSGSFNQSSAIESKGEFQSSQFLTQARLSDLAARSAETRGKEESEESKAKTKTLIGRQRAAMAAQGIDIGSGSALEIQLETAGLGAVDALTIKNNAFKEATGYRIEAIDYRQQAGLTSSSASNQARNTILTGGLTAASQVAQGASAFNKITT